MKSPIHKLFTDIRKVQIYGKNAKNLLILFSIEFILVLL